MSANLVNVYAPVPNTERGRAIVAGAHPKGETVTFPCGRGIVIRGVKNPLQADIYTEHSHQTTVAKYSPSGFYICSGDVTGKVRIWDTVNKEHILKIELPVLGGEVRDLAWSPDNQRIVAVGNGNDRFGVPFLWDSGSSVGEIAGHSKPINSVDFKQSRPFRVQTASEDFSTAWFEGPPFKFKFGNKDHDRFVNCVRFSPDGNKSLSVGSDKKGFFYDGKEGKKVGELEPVHKLGIYGCAWSPDSQRVATASADKTVRVFDAEGHCLKTFEIGPDVTDQQLGILWIDEDTIISFGLGGDYHYIHPENGVQKTIYGHQKFVNALAFDSANQKLISASFDAKVVLWDIESGETSILKGKGHTNQIVGLGVQDGHLITLSMDDTVRASSLGNGEWGNSLKLDTTPVGLAVGHMSDVSVAVTKASINIFRGGKLVGSTKAGFEPSAVAINHADNEVAVGGQDKKVHVYSLSGDKLTEKYALDKHRGPISALSYARNGLLASVDTTARDVYVWEGDKPLVNGWCFHTAKVNSIGWAPDSVHLATGSLDSSFYVWDLSKQDKRIHMPNAHVGGVNGCVWISPNTLATCGQDCAVKTWQVQFA